MRRVGAAVNDKKAAEKYPSTSSRTISAITGDNTYAWLSILPSNLYTLLLVSCQLLEQERREDTKRQLGEKVKNLADKLQDIQSTRVHTQFADTY